MTDTEVRMTLARRDGFSITEHKESKQFLLVNKTRVFKAYWHDKPEYVWLDAPDYPNSRDAIASVLGKLSPAEWRELYRKLIPNPTIGKVGGIVMKEVLTLPPADLARAVAEAIKACEKEEPL